MKRSSRSFGKRGNNPRPGKPQRSDAPKKPQRNDAPKKPTETTNEAAKYQKKEETTGPSLPLPYGLPESFFGDESIVRMYKHNKHYDDNGGKKRVYTLPHDFSVTITTADIIAHVRDIYHGPSDFPTLVAFKNSYYDLITCFMQRFVTYDIVLDADLFKNTVNGAGVKAGIVLPPKLQQSFTFMYHNAHGAGPKEARRALFTYPSEVAYSFTRFMIPSEPLEGTITITTDEQEMRLDNPLVIKKLLDSTIKSTFGEIYECYLKSWEKVAYDDVIAQYSGDPKTAADIRKNTIIPRREQLLDIINMLFYYPSRPSEKIRNEDMYALVIATAFFNPRIAIEHFWPDLAGYVSLDIFDTINCFKFDARAFEEAKSNIEKSVGSSDTSAGRELLIDLLDNTRKLVMDDSYRLYDHDNRYIEIMLSFIAKHYSAFMVETGSTAEKLMFKLNTAFIDRPDLSASEDGITKSARESFETKYSNDPQLLLKEVFDYMMRSMNMVCNSSVSGSKHWIYFLFYKKYYHDKGGDYRNMLFNAWSTTNYYGYADKIYVGPISALFDWCLFIHDSEYTKLFLEIMYRFPTQKYKRNDAFVSAPMFFVGQYQDSSSYIIQLFSDDKPNKYFAAPKQIDETILPLKQFISNIADAYRDEKGHLRSGYFLNPLGNACDAFGIQT